MRPVGIFLIVELLKTRAHTAPLTLDKRTNKYSNENILIK